MTAQEPKSAQTIVVRGPTVVAFSPHVTDAELERDPDKNEVLSDFQLYATQASEPLRKMGVDFQQVYAPAFQIRRGRKLTTFHPGKIDVGYYLVAPGKKPRIEYGVMTDIDLVDIAKEYFGIAAK
jgi:hypothetical protein